MKHRHGLTLVELLAVIAIISILTAIILPAVQRAREASRRIACANNLRQLSLGLLNFESSHGHLPTGLVSDGASSSNAETYLGMSWITRVLPFVEQNRLWDNAIADYRSDPVPFRSHTGMQTVLSVIGCPSDPASGTIHQTHDDLVVACTDYLGISGRNFIQRDGVFTYDQEVRLSSITDGLSNTLMVGERPPSPDFWYGWWYATGSGRFSTGDVTLGVAELNPSLAFGGAPYLDGCPAGPYQYVRGSNSQCDTLHYWSFHSNGSNFVRADGSVGSLEYSIDAAVISSLSTRAGGESNLN